MPQFYRRHYKKYIFVSFSGHCVFSVSIAIEQLLNDDNDHDDDADNHCKCYHLHSSAGDDDRS